MPRAAILSLFATACVGSLTGGDIAPPDQPPPAPVTDVTVEVRDGSLPQANVKVIFQANDDSIVADLATDTTGRATADMPNGGIVTVIRTYPPTADGKPRPDDVYTYLGVKTGDRLTLVGPPRDGDAVVAKIYVGLDPGTPVTVMTPCGSATGAAPVIDLPLKGCGSETDFLVMESSTGEPLYFSAHAAIAPQIDFSGETFRGSLTTELRASNMMTQAQVALQKRLVMNNFTVFDSGALATATATTAVPDLPDTEQLLSAYVAYEGRTYVITSRDAFAPTPATIDIASRIIPSSSAPKFAGNTLWWDEVGSGTADFSVGRLTVASAADRQFVRHVAGAHFFTSLRLPPLPAPYDHYDITGEDIPRIVHNLATVDGGYDAVRARVFNHALADFAPIGGTAAASLPATSQ